MADNKKSTKKRTNLSDSINQVHKSLKTEETASPSLYSKDILDTENQSNKPIKDDDDDAHSISNESYCSCSSCCSSCSSSKCESHDHELPGQNEDKLAVKKVNKTSSTKAKQTKTKTVRPRTKKQSDQHALKKATKSSNGSNRSKKSANNSTVEPVKEENEPKPKKRMPPEEDKSSIKLPAGIKFKKLRSSIEKVTSSPDDFKHSPIPFVDFNNNSQINTFEKMRINSDLIEGLRSLNIREPNELQMQLLPFLLENRTSDIYLRTLPHTGKKVSILLGLMHRINTEIHEPQVIYLTPTNDLTIDLYEGKCKKLIKYTRIEAQAISRHAENGRRINKQLIVSPIGTLLYLIREKCVDVNNVKCLYLDEIDLLLSSDPNVKRIQMLIDHMKSSCQVIFHSSNTEFSALDLIRTEYRRRPILVDFLKHEDYFKNILQFHVTCQDLQDKWMALLKVIESSVFKKFLVYCCGHKSCSNLSNRFYRLTNYRVKSLNTDIPLEERLETLSKLKDNQKLIVLVNSPLLVGIDIGDEPAMLINYDLYKMTGAQSFDYLQRISNCLRHKRPGFVVNLSMVDTLDQVTELQDACGTRFIELDALGKLERASMSRSRFNSDEYIESERALRELLDGRRSRARS